MALATSSLPDPVSPVMETVIFVLDAFSISAKTFSMGSLLPTMIWEKSYLRPTCFFRLSTSCFRVLISRQMQDAVPEPVLGIIVFHDVIKGTIF